jgi:hypothetical protein
MTASEVLGMDLNVGSGFERMRKTMDNLAKSMKANAMGIQNALLGIGLAFLFTGMAIKKFFGDLIKTAFNTFESIIGDNNRLIRATRELNASWEFFKFSIVEALSQSDLFVAMVLGVVNLLGWFNALSPAMKRVIGWTILIIFLFGFFMTLMGNALLFLMGLFIAIQAGFGGALLAGFIIFIVILALIIALFIIWGSDMTKTEKIIWTIVAVMAALLVVGIALGLVSLVFFAWAIAIIGIMVILGLLVKKFGSVREALIRWGQAILLIFSMIADGIITILLFPLRMFMEALIIAINAFNALTGSNISVTGIQSALDATAPGFVTRELATILDDRNKAFEQEAAKEEEMSPKEATKQGTVEAFEEMGLTGNFMDSFLSPDVFK